MKQIMTSEFNLFKDGKYYGYGFNSNVVIICNTDIKDNFCIDAKAFDMMKLLDGEITINKSFNIKSSKGKYKAKLIESNFIEPNLDFDNNFTINTNDLKIAKDFVSNNEARPIFTGVNLNDLGQVVATDSMILFRNKDAYSENNITLPTQFIDLMPNDKEITISFNKRQCMFEYDDVKYISRLIEGNYPDVRKLFNYSGELNTISINDYLDVANKIGGYASFNNNIIKFEGDSEFETECKHNMDCCITFNNLLKVCKYNNTLNILYKGPTKPLLINDKYIILPVIKGE